MIGDAVNVTRVGPQTGLADGVTATATGRFVSTAIVTVFDMAGLPRVHGSLEVSSQVTTSLLTGICVKIVLLVPAGTAFTYHW